MSSPILGNVVFDLTFLNEVSKKHETIKGIHAQVLDSCIAIIVGRLWPKPLTEMTVVKLSYQLKLTNHTILYKVIECQINVGSHCMSDHFKVNVVCLLPGMRHL